MTPDGYYFGTRLAVRCDYYAFPRTGSHYLWACLTGLLDLVFFPNEHVDNPEARQRVEELNPYAYYAMRLREDGLEKVRRGLTSIAEIARVAGTR